MPLEKLHENLEGHHLDRVRLLGAIRLPVNERIAVNRMIEEGIQGVEFVAINTDAPLRSLSLWFDGWRSGGWDDVSSSRLEVRLDGKLVGKTPWVGESAPGRHVAVVALSGHAEVRKELEEMEKELGGMQGVRALVVDPVEAISTPRVYSRMLLVAKKILAYVRAVSPNVNETSGRPGSARRCNKTAASWVVT